MVTYVYNNHPRDPKIVAAVDCWSLFGGHLCYKRSNWDLKIMVVIDRWSLFRGGRYISSGLTVFCYPLYYTKSIALKLNSKRWNHVVHVEIFLLDKIIIISFCLKFVT